MLVNVMLSHPQPKSNYQRQVEFRQRNPGYFRKYSARRSELRKAAKAMVLELMQAQIARPEPLMLPAPVERIEIPGMTTIEPIREKIAR